MSNYKSKTALLLYILGWIVIVGGDKVISTPFKDYYFIKIGDSFTLINLLDSSLVILSTAKLNGMPDLKKWKNKNPDLFL